MDLCVCKASLRDRNYNWICFKPTWVISRRLFICFWVVVHLFFRKVWTHFLQFNDVMIKPDKRTFARNLMLARTYLITIMHLYLLTKLFGGLEYRKRSSAFRLHREILAMTVLFFFRGHLPLLLSPGPYCQYRTRWISPEGGYSYAGIIQQANHNRGACKSLPIALVCLADFLILESRLAGAKSLPAAALLWCKYLYAHH